MVFNSQGMYRAMKSSDGSKEIAILPLVMDNLGRNYSCYSQASGNSGKQDFRESRSWRFHQPMLST
jgi:hypothetical protein